MKKNYRVAALATITTYSGGVVPASSELDAVELELESYSFTAEHEVKLQPDCQQRRSSLRRFIEGYTVVPYLEYHLKIIFPKDPDMP